MKKSGLTMQQFLVIIVVIGTVALMVYMARFNDQRQQNVSKLKKVYFTLSDTTASAIRDNGPVTTWEIGKRFSGEAAVKFADRYLIPYLKVAKNCGTKTVGDCEFKHRILSKGYPPSSFGSRYARFYLDDGTLIALTPIYGQEISIVIDVNGQKPPNTNGKDIFYYQYYIYNRDPDKIGKFIPFLDNTNRDYLKSACGILTNKGHGMGCAALIMRDGWQIKDD